MTEKYFIKRRVIDWEAVSFVMLFVFIFLFLNVQILEYVLEYREYLYVFAAINIVTFLTLCSILTSINFTKIIKEEVYLEKVKKR